MPLQSVYKQLIFDPLELKHTYLPCHEDEYIPNMYMNEITISRPNFIRGCRASGGIISTTRELMTFMKAFFGGELFNKTVFQHLNKYNKLQLTMFPIQYGGGYMRIPLNGFPTLFMGDGDLLGHSGTTGSFAFYYPIKDIYFVGDMNQLANPSLPIRLVMRLALSIK
ncbi:CubicO group peptidase (beta-lactamase class C family) [Metabacillus malikii]|uniref:CubicO group peptidase (Beta-lactamase class C family) n=2 Tax=Metabacillus malikii TaxID=1504265 RepID=A0ABT9ZD13_9BACI|nr:CubicO group peptidase (beta-lactamase class C family) [Metabacillus malikii]